MNREVTEKPDHANMIEMLDEICFCKKKMYNETADRKNTNEFWRIVGKGNISRRHAKSIVDGKAEIQGWMYNCIKDEYEKIC